MKRLLIAALSTVCLVGSAARAHDFQDAHDYCEQHRGTPRPGESVNLCADRITEAHASKPAECDFQQVSGTLPLTFAYRHCTTLQQKATAHRDFCKAVDNDGGTWADRVLDAAKCTREELQ